MTRFFELWKKTCIDSLFSENKQSFDKEQQEKKIRGSYPCKGREKQEEIMEDKDLLSSWKAGQALALREEGHKAQLGMKTVRNSRLADNTQTNFSCMP